jgi:competence protein ComEA
MVDDRREAPAPVRSARALLRGTDQISIAILLATALTAMWGVQLWRGWQGRPVSDIDRAPARTVEFRIDINRADWPEFTLLPGVGETLARRIVASRRSEGPFRTHEDLCRVHGIGPAKLQAIQPYLLPIRQTEP